jgi:transcriptional regulator with XRE-family HTH domain
MKTKRFQEAFSAEMKKARLARGWSLDEVAACVASQRANLSLIEQGRQMPGMQLGLAICRLLEIDASLFPIHLGSVAEYRKKRLERRIARLRKKHESC